MRFEITQGGKGNWTPVGKIPEEQLAKTRNEDVGNFSGIYFPLNVGEESEQRAGESQVRESPLRGPDLRTFIPLCPAAPAPLLQVKSFPVPPPPELNQVLFRCFS